MNYKALFAGTFDPPTLGHIELIRRGAKVFDELIVGIGENSAKQGSMLSIQDRLEGLKRELSSLTNVEVVKFSGLATQFAKEQGIRVLLRGIRSSSDVEYEMQMARANRKIGDIETFFLISDTAFDGISSSLIRELVINKAPLNDFIPEQFERMIYNT